MKNKAKYKYIYTQYLTKPIVEMPSVDLYWGIVLNNDTRSSRVRIFGLFLKWLSVFSVTSFVGGTASS